MSALVLTTTVVLALAGPSWARPRARDKILEIADEDFVRLFEAIDQDDIAALPEIARRFRSRADRAIPVFKQALGSDKPEIQAAALSGMEMLGTRSEPLAIQAADLVRNSRSHAVQSAGLQYLAAYGWLNAEASVDAIQPLTHADDVALRGEAAWQLQHFRKQVREISARLRGLATDPAEDTVQQKSDTSRGDNGPSPVRAHV